MSEKEEHGCLSTIGGVIVVFAITIAAVFIIGNFMIGVEKVLTIINKPIVLIPIMVVVGAYFFFRD